MQAAARWAAIVIFSVQFAACGNNSDDAVSNNDKPAALTAFDLGEQLVLEPAEYLAMEPYRGADLENGKRQTQICQACHSLTAGGPNMIGPALYAVFGRQVGGQDGFGYSQAMIDVDFVWTPLALDAWLAQPASFLPGNRMTFAGVFRESDRNDLIAYLLQATAESGGRQQD